MRRSSPTPNELLSDEELMSLVQKRNRKAFEMLYDRYFDKLVGFAEKFTGNEHQAEDAVQDIFIKLAENPRLFDVQKKFSTWVYTVTGNSCKNIIRNENNRMRILEDTMKQSQNRSSAQQHGIDYHLLRDRINSLYLELNDKEKKIFVLRFEHELPIKEIAQIADIPEGSVKSGIYYMLKKFAYHLKEFTHDN